MRQLYFFLACGLLSTTITFTNAQSLKLERYIMVTDTIVDGGVMVAVSSDDAEQENDEIDALYDDDLDAGWEGAPEDQNILTTGLRFRNVTIPEGAVIDSAFLYLSSHEGKSTEDVARITIAGEAADDAKTFTEDALITDRPKTASSVLWVVDDEWDIWEEYRTPDISSVVQEVVAREEWKAGNALALLLQGEDQGLSDYENAREFESFENIADPEDGGDGQNHPERRPRLVVYFSVTSARIEIPIMVTDTIEDEGVIFAASSDDAEQENDEMDSLFDDDLDAGWEGAPEDQNNLTTGLRFRGLEVPVGAVIDSAFIEVWSHEAKSAEDVARITIAGEATDDAETFTEDALITDRPRTSATTLWEVAEEWELWGKYRTPDISTVVQEIIDRGGWTPGNDIALFLLGEDQGLSDFENAREFESFENIADPEDGGDGQNHPERRPRLIVYYSSGTSSLISLKGPDVHALKVYPNPTSPGIVTIEFTTDGPAVIRLFDVKGQLIRWVESELGSVVQFETGNVPAGIYYLQAIQGKQIYAQKLQVTNR